GGTQAFSFHDANCPRVRVLAGFQSLPARWKKHGHKLEVLVPSDDVTVKGESLPPARCSFSVTLRDSVYLLLRNGKLIEVPQEERSEERRVGKGVDLGGRRAFDKEHRGKIA